MNELEYGVVKINIEMMSKSQIIESIKHKLKYIPLDIQILELAVLEQEKAKQISASEELVLDVTLLKLMAESLQRKCNPHRDAYFVPLDKIPSTTDGPIEEHDPVKLPHEFTGAIADPTTIPGEQQEVTLEDAMKEMLDKRTPG